MKPYKAVVFDIDGTLLNTVNMNLYPLIQIIKEELNEDWSFEEVKHFYFYPGMKTMHELGIKDPETVYARWVSYVNAYKEGATLYEGIEETLKKIPVPKAVVSAKKKAQYKIDMEAKGLDGYFKARVLEEDTKNHKPDPEPLLLAAKQLGLQPNELLYIGDAPTDLQASRAAGCDFGLAKWGSLHEVHGSDYVFEKPQDILQLFK